MFVSRFDIHSENDELSNALQKFWDTESLGVRDEPFESKLDGGESLKNIHFDEKEGRYEVFLPWKEGHFPASNEYNVCNKVKTAALTTEENKELLRDYDNVIKDYQRIDQGSSQIRNYQSRNRK